MQQGSPPPAGGPSATCVPPAVAGAAAGEENSTKKGSSSREETTAEVQRHQQQGVVADQAEASREVQPGEEREATKRRAACDHCSAKKIRVGGSFSSEEKLGKERGDEKGGDRKVETHGGFLILPPSVCKTSRSPSSIIVLEQVKVSVPRRVDAFFFFRSQISDPRRCCCPRGRLSQMPCRPRAPGCPIGGIGEAAERSLSSKNSIGELAILPASLQLVKPVVPLFPCGQELVFYNSFVAVFSVMTPSKYSQSIVVLSQQVCLVCPQSREKGMLRTLSPRAQRKVWGRSRPRKTWPNASRDFVQCRKQEIS